MKVLLFNGSPHKEGCTFTALSEIQKTLKEECIDSEIYQIGINSISGCRACRACAKLRKCVIDDGVNEFLEYAKDFDAFIFGSPVYYAAAAGGAFTITQMPIISGRYWNMVHGQTPDDVRQDLEGMQNMRILARNMAYYLKCIETGKNAGIELPK